MKSTFRGIIFIMLVIPFGVAFAQLGDDRNLTQEEVILLNNTRNLTAEVVDVKIAASIIDSMLTYIETKEEELFSPADDLYDGVWNSQYVNIYANVTVPDTFVVDLRSFVMPFEGPITSHFGVRRMSFHYGTDLKLFVGDTVVAAFEGKVRVKKFERRGYGNYVVLRHKNGLETIYGHLSKFLVNEGDDIEAGQPIGLGGNTGRSTGSHLHFECRLLGQAINPAEIVDFNNFCTFDDSYVFLKSNSYNKNSNTFTANNGSIVYHRIKSGDTLSTIARKYKVTVTQLCRLNGLKTTSILKIGRVIRCS